MPRHFAKFSLSSNRGSYPNLRLIPSGAAPLDTKLFHQLEQRFSVPVQEGYGLSEIASIGFSNPLNRRKPGSIGKPLPGLNTRLMDEQGQVIPDDDVTTTGELYLSGPSVMLGYWQQPEKTAQVFRSDGNDTWFKTGDLVSRDAEGYFYWHGRVDDVINVGGTQVYPQAIESVLRQHSGVADVAVVAMEKTSSRLTVSSLWLASAPSGLCGTSNLEGREFASTGLENIKASPPKILPRATCSS